MFRCNAFKQIFFSSRPAVVLLAATTSYSSSHASSRSSTATASGSNKQHQQASKSPPPPPPPRNVELDRLRQSLQRGGRGGQKRERAPKPHEIASGNLGPQTPPSFREQLMLIHRMRRKKKLPERILARKRKCREYSSVFNMSFYFKEADLKESSILGRGPGGQATNRRMQTCQIRHEPSGICVRFSKFRSLYANRKAARMMLSQKLEQRLFGKYSALGMVEHARNTRRKKRALMRQRLLREHERANQQQQQHHQHDQKQHQQDDEPNQHQHSEHKHEERQYFSACCAGGSSPTTCFSLLRVSSLCDAFFGKEALCSVKEGKSGRAAAQQSYGCFGDMNFITVGELARDDAGGDMMPCCWKNICDVCGFLDGASPPKTRAEMMEPPFVDAWWKMLEYFPVRNNKNVVAADVAEFELGAITCPMPPAWFCVLFPRLPTSPQSRFIGPASAWESRERSYFFSQQQQHKTLVEDFGAMLRLPYRVFFEMFGLRCGCGDTSGTSTSLPHGQCVSPAAVANQQLTTIARDVGLNWFEGRARFQQSHIAIPLWVHVTASASEFELHDVLAAMRSFLTQAAEDEKHCETRIAIRRVLTACRL